MKLSLKTPLPLKRENFLQDKEKSHGKAAACRDFLIQCCGKYLF